ncbi:hypothetical protein E1285_14000 [Actinomadura sp. 7K507]|nr:hypothetical protein E1285_14000 [Actinomadura sp. 7K507]
MAAVHQARRSGGRRVYSMFEDPEGRMWFGTTEGGLDPRRRGMAHADHPRWPGRQRGLRDVHRQGQDHVVRHRERCQPV